MLRWLWDPLELCVIRPELFAAIGMAWLVAALVVLHRRAPGEPARDRTFALVAALPSILLPVCGLLVLRFVDPNRGLALTIAGLLPFVTIFVLPPVGLSVAGVLLVGKARRGSGWTARVGLVLGTVVAALPYAAASLSAAR